VSPFTDLLVFDAHFHVHAASGLRELAGVIREAGLAGMALMSLSACGAGREAQNLLVLSAKRASPEGFWAFPGLVYPPPRLRDGLDLAAQARQLVAAGADGVKMIEGKPNTQKALGLPLNDPVYDGFYGFLAAEQVPLLMHVGDPATFWDADACPDWARRKNNFWGDGTYASLEDLYGQVDDVLDRFGGLQVTLPHFYFLSDDRPRAESLLARYPNVRLDLTPGSEMYVNFSRDPAGWRAFFERYADRILFGTDNRAPLDGAAAHAATQVARQRRFFETAEPFETEWGTLHGLGLSRETLRKLYSENFLGWVGARPRPVDVPAAEEYRRTLLENLRRWDAPQSSLDAVRGVPVGP